MSQDLSKLTPQELIELAKKGLEQPQDNSLKSLSSVNRFIISENIQSGKEKIPAIIIYARYYTWASINNEDIISQPKFFQELQLYLVRKATGKGVFYFVNPTGFNLSKEYFIQAKQKHLAVKRNSRDKTKSERKKEKKETNPF